MNKLRKIQQALNVYGMNVKSVPDMAAAEGKRLAEDITFILSQPELTEDIVKPTASEVKQMIDELRDEMNKEFDKVRASARLHHQNYHCSGSGGTF